MYTGSVLGKRQENQIQVALHIKYILEIENHSRIVGADTKMHQD